MDHGNAMRAIADWARANEKAQFEDAARLAGGRNDFASQLYRGATQGLAELPEYMLASEAAGPVVGMAALGGLNNADQGVGAVVEGTLEGAMMGGLLKVMGPAGKAIRISGQAAMSFAQAKMRGADNTTALAAAFTQGGMAYPGGEGASFGDVARMNADRFMPSMGRLIPDFAVRSQLNPVKQRAVDYLQDNGVPLKVGTRTGNKWARAVEAAVEHSPLGAQQAEEFNRGTEEGLQNLAQRNAGRANASPASPESAGANTGKQLKGVIKQLQGERDKGYEAAWAARNDPSATRVVHLYDEPEIGDDGKPTGNTKPVMGPVNMPVDISHIQESARPLFEEMGWTLTPSEQGQSAGYNALSKLLKSHRHVSAWQAEHALSGLKSMARVETESGVRNKGEGVAASLIEDLESSIDEAVMEHGGFEALDGLRNGRKLHANVQETSDLLNTLFPKGEPVQAYKRLTWSGDSGVNFLREIQKRAPEAMTNIGRAFLDHLIRQATEEGGFSRAKGIANAWRNLGDETKKILFPDEQLRKDLDHFFLGAKMVGDDINTSGTQKMAEATSLNPLRWAAGYAGGKLFFTPEGQDWLMQGRGRRSSSGSSSRGPGGGPNPPGWNGTGTPPAAGGPNSPLGRLQTAAKNFLQDDEGTQWISRSKQNPAIFGAQVMQQGVNSFGPWSEEMQREYGTTSRRQLQSLWDKSKAISDRVNADVKRRSMEDLDVRIPDKERVVSTDPTKTIDGQPFHSLDVDKPGEGFLPYRQLGGEKANDLIQQLWDKAIRESEAGGGTTAADAVKKLGARPPDAKFWDESFSLPERARFWYELSGEAFIKNHMDLPKKEVPRFIDAVAGTSGGVEPGPNLQRAIGITAERMQNEPVTTDLRDKVSARNAMNPKSDLSSLKYGSFSGTMQYTSGLSGKKPLTTNDVQVASMFGIKGTDIGQNPVMYEVLSRFFLNMRDAQNAAHPEGTKFQPWETWQMQAPAWVQERIRKDPSKASEYDDYSQVFPAIIKKLQDAGIPTPGGKVTMETLMDPRTPNVMSGTRQQFLNSRIATVEVGTTLTPQGWRAANLARQLQQMQAEGGYAEDRGAGDDKNPNAAWVRNALEEYNQIHRNAMMELARRAEVNGKKIPSLVSRLMSGIAGRKVEVSRLDWDGFGTFEGEISPNLLIPLFGRQSEGYYNLNEVEREAFLSYLGTDLHQKAMASSHFKAVEHGTTGETYSIFLERYDKGTSKDAINAFSNKIGFPVNVVQHPNGTVIDINIGDKSRLPDRQAIEDAYNQTLAGDANIKRAGIFPREYDSDYVDRSGYAEKIRALKATKPQFSGPEGAEPPTRDYGDIARARAEIQAIARRRDRAFKTWSDGIQQRLVKERAKSSSDRGVAAGSESPILDTLSNWGSKQ
jgi:hypothetical protein